MPHRLVTINRRTDKPELAIRLSTAYAEALQRNEGTAPLRNTLLFFARNRFRDALVSPTDLPITLVHSISDLRAGGIAAVRRYVENPDSITQSEIDQMAFDLLTKYFPGYPEIHELSDPGSDTFPISAEAPPPPPQPQFSPSSSESDSDTEVDVPLSDATADLAPISTPSTRSSSLTPPPILTQNGYWSAPDSEPTSPMLLDDIAYINEPILIDSDSDDDYVPPHPIEVEPLQYTSLDAEPAGESQAIDDSFDKIFYGIRCKRCIRKKVYCDQYLPCARCDQKSCGYEKLANQLCLGELDDDQANELLQELRARDADLFE